MIREPDGENYWRTPVQFRTCCLITEDKESYSTSRLGERLMGNWEWRPVIALFSISRKLISRPKAFYSAEWELRAAVWTQANSSEWRDLNRVRTETPVCPDRVRFCSQESGNTCLNANPCLIWTVREHVINAPWLSKCLSMFYPRNVPTSNLRRKPLKYLLTAYWPPVRHQICL